MKHYYELKFGNIIVFSKTTYFSLYYEKMISKYTPMPIILLD